MIYAQSTPRQCSEEHSHPVRVVILAIITGMIVCVASVALLASPASAGVVQRGIVESRLADVGSDDGVTGRVVDDLRTLNAGWTRIPVRWSQLQPSAPTANDAGYNEAYFTQLEATAQQLQAAGIKVIVTLYLVPKWASNKALWESPPPSYARGYQAFYAMHWKDAAVMASYRETCKVLAQRLGQYGVRHYECGNEPNLYCYLYPQRRPGSAYYGPKTYLKMLTQFYKGVKAANANNVVIGGANSPRGGDDAISTTPQRFAGYLKSHGAAKYFDAYSHHPYVTGGQRISGSPDLPPYSTRRAVTMYNIGQLLRLWPKKPFYITEYGYSTSYMKQFNYRVTLTQQATYLRKAYAMAAKHQQIKAMLWFLIRDNTGTFTGLQKQDGLRKPSWYAFARGNGLTLVTPRRAKAGRYFTVSGVLTVREAAYADGQKVKLQTRTSAGKPWKLVKTLTTKEGGAYRFTLARQSRTKQYRVQWPGVCMSRVRTVRTP